MRILASSLHELTKILHPSQVEADLLPVYKTCLTCNDQIRERIYEHVDVIISRVSIEVGWDMFEDLARAWKDGSLGGWRAREQLAVHLPKMLAHFKDVTKGEKVLDVLRAALLDPFAAVRDGVTKGVSLSKQVERLKLIVDSRCLRDLGGRFTCRHSLQRYAPRIGQFHHLSPTLDVSIRRPWNDA